METLVLKDKRTFQRVIRVLREGGVVCVPTDTVYGLIADATNEDAVKRIFEIKGRPKEKALSFFVFDIRQARKYAEISAKQEKFLEKVWPGAVIAVLGQKTPVFSAGRRIRTGRQEKELRGFQETIGMRAPKDEFLQKILGKMGVPLAQSSANISGKMPARSANEALKYFEGRTPSPAFCLDGGAREGKASSVVDLTGEKPIMLREGAVSKAVLLRYYNT